MTTEMFVTGTAQWGRVPVQRDFGYLTSSAPSGGMGGVEGTGASFGSPEAVAGRFDPELDGPGGLPAVGPVSLVAVPVETSLPATEPMVVPPPLVAVVGVVPTGAVLVTPDRAGPAPRRGKDGRRRRRRSE
jgi:hypothetical protein